ncbi:PREDICTED: ras association domain-containing protein 1 [Sturnus vulgaris]|nr:PREDICTED: ras association domain-containing protein 1 [Sturnus vulgaris]
MPAPAPPPSSARGRRAMELIELRELQPEPRPGRGRLERANALRISPARRPGPGAHPDPRLTAAPGAGHSFEPRRRGLHTWCDLCGDFVWGGGRKSLQCRREYPTAPRAPAPPSAPPPPGIPAPSTPSRHRASRHSASSALGTPGEHRISRHRASPPPGTLTTGHSHRAPLQDTEHLGSRQTRGASGVPQLGLLQALGLWAPGTASKRRTPLYWAPTSDCSFTCHYRCRALVRLDCSGPPGAGDEDDGNEQVLEKDTNVDEPSEWEKTELDQAQVEQRIKEYNSQINSNLFMSLNKDGSYTGFIKVQLKLVRPVSVPATKRVPQAGRPHPQGVKRRTSFYLPKGTVKHLHILSHTRASEVIDALLRKFTVIDNPRKFALFERSEKDEQVYLRKLGDDEQPLRLRLLAGPSEKVLSFILKENETGEVNWDAFTLPELHNFLLILQREEEEHVRRLRHRYARCRQKMQEALATRTPG